MPRKSLRLGLYFAILSLVTLPLISTAAGDPVANAVGAYHNSTTAGASSGASGASTTTTTDSDAAKTDPLSQYLQFDPQKNSAGLSSSTVLSYLTGSDDPVTVTFRFINIALSFLGLVSTLFILYAGVVWFTARDNEEKAKEAKEIVMGAIVGLVLTLGSLAISVLLFSFIASATGNV